VPEQRREKRMHKYNEKLARALVAKYLTYGELDQLGEQLEAAIEKIQNLEYQLRQANGMVEAILNVQAFEKQTTI
jgi:phage-related tail protein